MPPPARPGAAHYDGVQALRFLAALAVVLLHANFYVGQRLTDQPVSLWTGGAWGVDIFFVISGFVMVVSTQTLIGNPRGWRVFFMRRVVRIAPLYWIIMSLKVVLLLALPSALFNNPFDLERVVTSYFFIPSRNPAGMIEPIHGVGWTLNFEMFFYAMFAAAMFLRISVFRFVGPVLAFCALMSVLRDEKTWPAITFYFDPIVLEFFWGMIIARLALRHAPPPAAGLALAAAGFALILGRDAAGPVGEALAVVGVGPALAVAGVVVMEPWLSGRTPRPLLVLGDASYSIYLFHPLVAPVVPAVFAKLGLIEPDAAFALAAIFAICASMVVYYGVEMPVLRWMKRVFSVSLSAKPQAEVAART